MHHVVYLQLDAEAPAGPPSTDPYKAPIASCTPVSSSLHAVNGGWGLHASYVEALLVVSRERKLERPVLFRCLSSNLPDEDLVSRVDEILSDQKS